MVAAPAAPGPLIVIDADARTAAAVRTLGYRLVFVQWPNGPVPDLLDDDSSYYPVDFTDDSFADFVVEVLAPLRPAAVVSVSPAGIRAADVVKSRLGTAGIAVPSPGAALFLNNHPYSYFSAGGRYILPAAEIDIHLITRDVRHGGVDELAAHPLAHVTVCDENDESWRRVSEWALRHHPISRIIAVHEGAVLLAAELRSRFGLAGIDHETALRFRDKARMKEAVRAAGAATVPDFSTLDSLDDLANVDWSTGRKVIKSRWEMAARDLYFVDTLDEGRRLAAGLDLSGSRYEVEEFIEGQIYHCDSVVQDGLVRFSSVGRYLGDPAGFAPDGVFGTVLVNEGELAKRITELNARVVAALGLRDGTSHLEVFHTAADELVFCEVACRPPGGTIPPVLRWQFGFDIVEAHIRLDAGLGIRLGSGVPSSGTTGFIAFYPGVRPRAGVAAERFPGLGIVEHVPGTGGGGVRHSTDFFDSYVVKAPDADAVLRRFVAIQDEYWQ